MLGTSIVCALLELFSSVMPLKWLKSIFNPTVTAITVMLLGISLIRDGDEVLGLRRSLCRYDMEAAFADQRDSQ